RKARKVMQEGRAISVTYDTREESNQNLGISLGCNGVIDVLIEPVGASDEHNPINFFKKFISAREPITMATAISSSLIGEKLLLRAFEKKSVVNSRLGLVATDLDQLFFTRKSEVKKYLIDHEETEVFLEFIQPPISLLIFGGGFDARPVCQLAKSLGWDVEVTDECVAHIAPVFFPGADKLSLCHREFVDREFDITPYTACILMSHNYEYDRDVLRKLIKTETPYIGILGPRKRFDKMQQEFLTEEIVFSEEDNLRIHSPIGLDIGAEAPDEISVSIIAEIQAKFSKRDGRFLKLLDRPIHQRDAHDDQVHKVGF
ncbi:MAG TPA: XdhC family protein, partial [Cyclobacteriaceae bacterium]|nr:XdhC family protein [Cyclobacteriaceae bacterium]